MHSVVSRISNCVWACLERWYCSITVYLSGSDRLNVYSHTEEPLIEFSVIDSRPGKQDTQTQEVHTSRVLSVDHDRVVSCGLVIPDNTQKSLIIKGVGMQDTPCDRELIQIESLNDVYKPW